MILLQEIISLAWSPRGCITFGSGKSLITGSISKFSFETQNENQNANQLFDISLLMKKRAELGYSMDVRAK